MDDTDPWQARSTRHYYGREGISNTPLSGGLRLAMECWSWILKHLGESLAECSTLTPSQRILLLTASHESCKVFSLTGNARICRPIWHSLSPQNTLLTTPIIPPFETPPHTHFLPFFFKNVYIKSAACETRIRAPNVTLVSFCSGRSGSGSVTACDCAVRVPRDY